MTWRSATAMHETSATAKRDVRLWWRDDDAGRTAPTLAPLLRLSRVGARPIGLAVVPAWLEEATIDLIRGEPSAEVLQHGWAHANHAMAGEKTIELGGTAATSACLDLLLAGGARLDAAFGAAFLPVLVPPWNRIADRVLERLEEVGYIGLSTFSSDCRGTAVGLVHINTHVDIIDWRGDRRMKPLDTLIAEVDHLLAQDGFTLIGILSHHLVMSVDDVARLGQFFRALEARHRCLWVAPRTLFDDSGRLFDEPADRRS